MVAARPQLPPSLVCVEHFEVVHEGAHPGLHLFLFGAGQEANVLAERNRHARHDDLDEAIHLERLHESRRQSEQRLAGAGGAEHGDEVDLGVHQQVQREVLLAIARGNAPHAVALAAIVADQLQRRAFAFDLADQRLDPLRIVFVHELVHLPLGAPQGR